MTIRCQWAGTDPLYVAYHDLEWGVPVHDDRTIFEFLILEGAQAGLSWSTILKKRDAYRAAFDNFDPAVVAAYGETKVAELLANPGIVRNRAKIASAIKNAQAFLAVQQEFGSFDAYIWQFVGGQPRQNSWQKPLRNTRQHARIRGHEQRPAQTRLQLRRPNDLLRPYAGNRHGQRPHRRLFPLPGVILE